MADTPTSINEDLLGKALSAHGKPEFDAAVKALVDSLPSSNPDQKSRTEEIIREQIEHAKVNVAGIVHPLEKLQAIPGITRAIEKLLGKVTAPPAKDDSLDDQFSRVTDDVKTQPLVDAVPDKGKITPPMDTDDFPLDLGPPDDVKPPQVDVVPPAEDIEVQRKTLRLLRLLKPALENFDWNDPKTRQKSFEEIFPEEFLDTLNEEGEDERVLRYVHKIWQKTPSKANADAVRACVHASVRSHIHRGSSELPELDTATEEESKSIVIGKEFRQALLDMEKGNTFEASIPTEYAANASDDEMRSAYGVWKHSHSRVNRNKIAGYILHAIEKKHGRLIVEPVKKTPEAKGPSALRRGIAKLGRVVALPFKALGRFFKRKPEEPVYGSHLPPPEKKEITPEQAAILDAVVLNLRMSGNPKDADVQEYLDAMENDAERSAFQEAFEYWYNNGRSKVDLLPMRDMLEKVAEKVPMERQKLLLLKHEERFERDDKRRKIKGAVSEEGTKELIGAIGLSLDGMYKAKGEAVLTMKEIQEQVESAMSGAGVEFASEKDKQDFLQHCSTRLPQFAEDAPEKCEKILLEGPIPLLKKKAVDDKSVSRMRKIMNGITAGPRWLWRKLFGKKAPAVATPPAAPATTTTTTTAPAAPAPAATTTTPPAAPAPAATTTTPPAAPAPTATATTAPAAPAATPTTPPAAPAATPTTPPAAPAPTTTVTTPPAPISGQELWDALHPNSAPYPTLVTQQENGQAPRALPEAIDRLRRIIDRIRSIRLNDQEGWSLLHSDLDNILDRFYGEGFFKRKQKKSVIESILIILNQEDPTIIEQAYNRISVIFVKALKLMKSEVIQEKKAATLENVEFPKRKTISSAPFIPTKAPHTPYYRGVEDLEVQAGSWRHKVRNVLRHKPNYPFAPSHSAHGTAHAPEHGKEKASPKTDSHEKPAHGKPDTHAPAKKADAGHH